MACDGNCFECKYDDCILTDKELIKQMRRPKSTLKRKTQPNRIGNVKQGEFKAEFILTPLPGSPEVVRTWEVNNEGENKTKSMDG